MKKILITTPYFLPAFPSEEVQFVANLVKSFDEGVAYFIICQDVNINGAELEGVSRHEWIEYNSYTQVLYASPGQTSDTIVKQVELLRPDILFIIGLFSWHFNIVPLMFCKGPRKIISTMGLLLPGAGVNKKWGKWFYLNSFKLLEYHYKVDFQVINEEERNFISGYFKNIPKVWISEPLPENLPLVAQHKKEKGRLKLLSIAVLNAEENILEVLQGLAKVTSNIEFTLYSIVKDDDYFQLCNGAIKALPSNVTFHYFKELEMEKLPQVFGKCDAFICCQSRESFNHSIYEALSFGKPVITSTEGRWKQLKNANAGLNIRLDNPYEIAEAVNFFADMDEAGMESWSRSAHAYAEEAIQIEKIKNQYAEMFGLKSV